MGGWKLHSYVVVPAVIYRKKGFFEIIFGWIPVIGKLFQSKDPDVYQPSYIALIFEKEE